MKRVLITGANSYVGTNVEKWLMREPDKYYVETLDMKDPNWKNFDFSRFDVVFHVAGIAHIREKKSLCDLYFKINRDLAFETAKKSKDSGVNHFIFMSSMSVYGDYFGEIDNNTKASPNSFYSHSKYEAEKMISNLIPSDSLSILRPPMIYGSNCPGNYNRLRKISRLFPIFPNYKNKKSFIYIKNLAIIIKQVIDERINGIILPKDNDDISTYDFVKTIRKSNQKNTIGISIFNFLIKFLNKNRRIRKVFGSLFYVNRLKAYNETNLIGFQIAIEETEKYYEDK